MRQLKRDYYTTGEMARVAGCSSQTVIRWLDAGKLPGYRLPGRGGERRCLKVVFREYLITHGLPLARLEALEAGPERALAVSSSTLQERPRG